MGIHFNTWMNIKDFNYFSFTGLILLILKYSNAQILVHFKYLILSSYWLDS